MSRTKKKAAVHQMDASENRYVNIRTILAFLLSLAVVAGVIAVIAAARFKLSREQIFATNRTRIGTVIKGLESGVMENDELYDEYDQLYIAKLRNTWYYYDNLWSVSFNDGFVQDAAEYAGVEAAAVIDSDGETYAAYNCDYDFTRKRFRMLREQLTDDGTSEPFSVRYEDGVKRFYGIRLRSGRILVFVVDWTDTQKSIETMTSWEAVLRGMISVDTVSIAVSLQDYSFLYNPIDNLTGRDALQNGVPIEALGENYEGLLTFGGDEWCAVGKRWNDAVVFVLTKTTTDLANDLVLIVFIAIIFIIFTILVSVYATIINRDNIRIGRMPRYIALLKGKFFFNITVAEKLLPIAVLGIVAVAGLTYYLQSVNALSSVAYESNKAIDEISNKLDNNTRDAEALNAEYKALFLNKCELLTTMLEENPQYIFDYDPEGENVHKHPVEKDDYGQITGGLDSYGNPVYSVSEHPFLQHLAQINAAEKIMIFDESGRAIATNDDLWYFTITDDEEHQSYPFWEILADHMDFYAQDLGLDDMGEYSQYVGRVFYYYTVQNPDGSTGYVSRSAYQKQRNGESSGSLIERHRGLLQISIAPERLQTVKETATLTYVADHTTIHGTGFTVICDADENYTCVYSPKPADIGRSALAMGCSAGAFNPSGEMYNGLETVNGEKYFQTFKMVDNLYIGTAVPLTTVFATRDDIALTAFFAALTGLLILCVYACSFGAQEEKMYLDNVDEAVRRARNDQDTITVTMPSGKTRKVRPAAARWDAEYIPWEEKTPEQKFSAVVSAVFHVFAVFLFVCILISRRGIFKIDAINYVYEGVWTKGFNIFAMTNCAITLITILVVANVLEIMINQISVNIGSRAETLGHLFASVIRYGTALFSLFYSLYLCGLDTGSLLASAGILSLIIGLGAQSMIQDILAGVFIVFEGEFRVGDIVTVGDFRGNVLDIGLRTTKIQDTSKNIKVFNNSNLSGIINMTKEASYAAVDVGIEYGADLERVEAVLAKELPKVRRRLPAIMDGPFYKGVSALGDSSVVLKFIALCKEQDRIQLSRDLNREIFLIFKRNDINIPYPQVTLSYLQESEPDPREKAERPEEKERNEGGSSDKEQKTEQAKK